MNTKVVEQLLTELEKETPCYILITCQKASSKGTMNAEMRYKGDATLAAYLLHDAQQFIEDQEEATECTPS